MDNLTFIFSSCIIGHKGIDPQTIFMVVSYGIAFAVMLVNNIYVQYKVKNSNDTIVKYLGQDDLDPVNIEWNQNMIKFETEISRTVNWMFLAFTLLNLPSKKDK